MSTKSYTTHGITVKFRIGVETFDLNFREKWNKGLPREVTPEEIAQKFYGICLLFGVKGQTKQMLLKDIEYAEKYRFKILRFTGYQPL